MQRFRLRLSALVLMTAGLLGCAQNPPAPVDDLSHAVGMSSPVRVPANVASDGYVVQTGDSLYAIAFRNQLDWRLLAGWNNIAAPYTIYPGLRLRLSAPVGYQPPLVTTAAPVFTPLQEPTPPATRNEPAGPTVVQAPTAPAVAAASAAPATATPAAENPSSPPPLGGPSRQVDGIRWQWPADGALLQGFAGDDPTRQGIDIAGRAGAPVRAAAEGVVVYSGNGLVGYGELVIVKHSDIYLSAYGHNRKRYVNEGERVQAGQQIAEMGSTGAPRTELHFEIRKQGKPIDPLGFLPSR